MPSGFISANLSVELKDGSGALIGLEKHQRTSDCPVPGERPLRARSGRSDKDAIPSLLATTRDTCFVTSGVIAGAGSGKTNTLAHRVAHLIVEGADPRRILLMAFSRRAASEMTKRVERIARKLLGDNAGIMTDALTWAGTYHGIGEWRFQLCNSLLHN
jgi:hypothetical protein